jgi:L-fuconolactonase
MPNFPIVDTHLHIWDPKNPKVSYPWLANVPFLNRPFLLEDYKKATWPVQVEKMVFLECDAAPEDFLAEANWVTEQSKVDPRIQGIVANASLEKGDGVRKDLEVLAKNPLVKGVRRLLQGEADNEFCLRPDFVRGVQALPDYGLSFDICIYERQLAATVKMVAQCPNVQFILDHIGKPQIVNHLMEPWKTELRKLAGFPNVWCKMSGLVTEADHKNWTAADLRPYIDHVIDCFGFGRVIYGGDWPVAFQATEYPRWVSTLDDAVAGASDREKHKLYHDNAIAFYRLPA